MKLFPCGHATHPQWPMAAALVLAQLRAQMALPDHAAAPTLGLLYITDHYAGEAQALLDFLRAELPQVTDWAGTVGVGVAVNNAEYFDEPGLAVMLCELPPDQYRVFSGVAPLGHEFEAERALVHADAGTPELTELIAEVAERTRSGDLFGGLATSRSNPVQFAIGVHDQPAEAGAARGVWRGGLSGVAFGADVRLVTRVTQGCEPVAPEREVTAVDGNLLLTLDGEPALDVLLRDLRLTLDEPLTPQSPVLATLRATLVGLSETDHAMEPRTGHFAGDVIVRHIVGLDPRRRGVAVADRPTVGMRLAFCQRHAQAARADLVRICAEIREELEPRELSRETAGALAAPAAAAAPHPARRIAGAVYVSCAGRGGPFFGGPSAELQILRHALGDVPLVGFFASGEIAGHRLYSYTGVLTVFTSDDPAA